MGKEIKSKRIPFYQSGTKWIPGAVYEIIRSFLKSDIQLNLSIETTPTFYSVALESEDKKYLLLTVKCIRKTIGNIVLDAVGYFYEENKKNVQPLSLVFENPPEVLEASDEVVLKCLTDIDFGKIRSNSKIIIDVIFDYVFIDKIRTINKKFTWVFTKEDDALRLTIK